MSRAIGHKNITHTVRFNVAVKVQRYQFLDRFPSFFFERFFFLKGSLNLVFYPPTS